MEVKKRNIVILSLSLVMICTVTFCAKFVKYIDITALKVIVHIFLNLSNGLIALIAMKLTNMKINIAPKNKRQYLIGAAIALVLNVVIAIVPAFCGFSLIGNHMDFSWTVLTYDFLFYIKKINNFHLTRKRTAAFIFVGSFHLVSCVWIK